MHLHDVLRRNSTRWKHRRRVHGRRLEDHAGVGQRIRRDLGVLRVALVVHDVGLFRRDSTLERDELGLRSP